MLELLNFILESLTQFDHALFTKINVDWANSAFDRVFPAITDLHQSPWSLLVLLPLLGFWIWRQRQRALKWILAALVAVAFSDMTAYRLVKPFVHRSRPPQSGVEFVLRTYQHGGDSFPSNHASNMAAVATVLSLALPPLTAVFVTIAALVSYSRVYCGVHFPLDVICGALLGFLIARLVCFILRDWLSSKRPLLPKRMKPKPPSEPVD